jgi:hypothetical protein
MLPGIPGALLRRALEFIMPSHAQTDWQCNANYAALDKIRIAEAATVLFRS